VTVAKLVQYRVEIVGVYIEQKADRLRELLGGRVGTTPLINWLLASQVPQMSTGVAQISLELHFQMLMRHPIVNQGVRLAAWHCYRFPES
jgi:hypothetical protein